MGVREHLGDLAGETPPDFAPAFPDRNLRSDTHYASDGRAIAQVEWLVDVTGQAYARMTRRYADGLGRTIQVVQNLDPAWGYENPSPPPCNRDATGQASTLNVCSQTVYDALGQATAQVDALGKGVIYQYNSLSQLVAVTDPLARTLQYSYDAGGNRVSTVDANGVATRFEYDPLGRLAAVVENYRPGFNPDPETNVRTEYSYDALGNRLIIRDGNNHVTAFTYDSLGRLSSERDPLGHTWQQRYDAAGRRVMQIDANGATIAYGYDGLDRLALIDYPAPQADVSFAYNALGWRTSMSDGVGRTQWVYDGVGRALSVTDPFSSTVSYAYNPSGGRASLTYPGGWTVSYQYDALERLTKVIAPATTVTYTHDVAGRLLSASLDNGLMSEYAYDDAGQLLGLVHRRGEERLSTFSYAYDPAGNRLQAQEWLRQAAPAAPYSTTISYDYDPLYRLTAADYSTGEYFHYAYDPVGNRLSEATPGGVITSTYDSANRLASVGGTSYTWDANGNLLSDGVNTYTFDHANRLVGVTSQQSLISYAYNGLGDRIQQTVGGAITDYTLDLAAGLTQVLADGTNTYLYGNGRIAQLGVANTDYFLGDALGSVRQLVDSGGGVTLVKSYMPYGEVLSSSGTTLTNYGYTGEWTSSGLVYLRSRYYDPGAGRFTQMDPSRLERNLFLYANANPVNHTDPTGLFSPGQIASSMGASSFDVLIQALYITVPFPLLPDDNKWGFFSALLDAEDGDSLQVGSLILMTSHPYVQYRAPERLWLKDCDQIMVGTRTLQDYFGYILTQPTYRELPAEYWRDTSPSYYLLSGQSTASKSYVDGADSLDLPDFHTVDLSIPRWVTGVNASFIVDRFGNQYVSVGSTIGYGTGGFSYVEGYLCAHGESPDCFFRTPSLTSDTEIRNILVGPCVSVGASLDLGGTIFACRPSNGYRGGGVIFSAGINAGIGGAGSWTIDLSHYLGKNQSMSWNWSFEDRLNGVGYMELMIKSRAQ